MNLLKKFIDKIVPCFHSSLKNYSIPEIFSEVCTSSSTILYSLNRFHVKWYSKIRLFPKKRLSVTSKKVTKNIIKNCILTTLFVSQDVKSTLKFVLRIMIWCQKFHRWNYTGQGNLCRFTCECSSVLWMLKIYFNLNNFRMRKCNNLTWF